MWPDFDSYLDKKVRDTELPFGEKTRKISFDLLVDAHGYGNWSTDEEGWALLSRDDLSGMTIEYGGKVSSSISLSGESNGLRAWKVANSGGAAWEIQVYLNETKYAVRPGLWDYTTEEAACRIHGTYAEPYIEQIDSKYIKGMYCEETKTNVLARGVSNSNSETRQLSVWNTSLTLPSLTMGREYTITVNDAEYQLAPTAWYNVQDGDYKIGFNLPSEIAAMQYRYITVGDRANTDIPFTLGSSQSDTGIYNADKVAEGAVLENVTLKIGLASTVSLPATVQILDKVTEIKTIDPKFIPNSPFVVTVTPDDSGNLIASAPASEIIAAYDAGRVVVCSFPLMGFQSSNFSPVNEAEVEFWTVIPADESFLAGLRFTIDDAGTVATASHEYTFATTQ